MVRNAVRCFIISFFAVSGHVGAAEAVPLLETSELRDFSKLGDARKKLIEAAVATGKEVAGMPYKFGGNGPKDGGFDCSGAMYHILRKVGLDPPRTSADQYLWVKQHSQLHLVANGAEDTEDKSFADLKPGDLVFWSGTYVPNDGRTVAISHVAIFMGFEKKDGRPVMINATDGRSYRGKKGNGFGVYDFKVPSPKSKSKMVAYGTPPGLE